MEFRRQWAIARRWFLLFVVFVVFASVPAYLFAGRQPSVYAATAQLAVGQPASGATADSLVVRQQVASDVAYKAKLRPMLEHIIETYIVTDSEGRTETPEHLASRVDIAADPEHAVLTVTARGGDPTQAAALANNVAQALVDASLATTTNSPDVRQPVAGVLAAVLERDPGNRGGHLVHPCGPHTKCGRAGAS